MPFHEHISTKFGATIVLWQLTENEQTIATLLSEKERRLIDSQNLSPKRFCERAASRLSLRILSICVREKALFGTSFDTFD